MSLRAGANPFKSQRQNLLVRPALLSLARNRGARRVGIRDGCAQLCGLVVKIQFRIFIEKEFILLKNKYTIYK
jgi:hypothetical protein